MRRRISISLTAVLVSAAGLTLIGASKKVTPKDAEKFIEQVEAGLQDLTVDASRGDWVKATYITDDTEILAAKLDERQINATVKFAKQSTEYSRIALSPVLDRKLKLLRNSLTLATPSDPAESAELTRIASSMEGTYGKGKYCPPGKDSWTSTN